MRTVMKKGAAAFMSLLLLALCFMPAVSAALPYGVSEAQITALIPKLDRVITGALDKEGVSLSDQLYDAIKSDDTMNRLFKAIYGALSEQASTMNTLGVDISVQGVKANLYSFPEVQAALGDGNDWSAVLTDSFAPRWNLKGKSDVKAAVGAMLAPLNDLLYTLLCGGRYTVSPFVTIEGANGYENAIVPLLKTLGVSNILSQGVFTERAGQSRFNMIGDVLDMAFTVLDAIAAAPVSELSTRLPGIAYYFENDGLKTAVTTLVEPLKVRVGLIQLTGIDSLIEKSDLFSSASDLTVLLQDLDVGAALGSDVKLTLPEIDLSKLAACGTGSIGSFTPDKTECFLTLFRWLVDAIKLNKAQLPSLLGSGVPQSLVDSFLARSADELLRLLIDLTNLNPADTVLDYTWETPAFTPGSVPYTEHLTEENFTKMRSEIDATLTDFLVELANSEPLPELLGQKIYSSKLVTTLMKAVYGALYSEQTLPMMELLGVAVTPAGVANAVYNSYPTVASALRRYSSWSSVPDDAFFWLTDGNRQGFVNAVTAILRPLRPMLTFLLAEGSITLLDAVVVPGSNGYNTAVIPILEALGCEADTIKTYAEYKSTAGGDKALTDVLDPIAALLDRLVETPVATVTEILPNIVFFIQSGGLKQCVENLLYPVKALLGKLGLESLLPTDLTESVGSIDIDGLLSSLADNGDLSLTLEKPDLDKLAGLGTLETLPSKRTAGGVQTTYSYVRANSEQVLVSILRYAVGTLKSEENSSVLSGMMQAEDMGGGGDMFATYAGKITEQLKTMTVDETIEWLYNLLFSETPKRDHSNEEEVPAFEYVEQKRGAFDYRTVLIVLGVILLLVLIVVLSRVNLRDMRERRKNLKKKRREQKEKLKQAIAESKRRPAPKKTAPDAKKTKKPASANEPQADAAPKKTAPARTAPAANAANEANTVTRSAPAPKQTNPLIDPLSSMRRKPAAEPGAPETKAPAAKRPAERKETPEQRAERLSKENAAIREKLKAEKAQRKEQLRAAKNAADESDE
ncbi:MAG: hypothetical protein IK104_06875 [Clostridia bacterium]|nr:hypothetical protein [Clostridia bacterium]MBR5410378.1 hypothetical protein [Clostridia bacterium]